MPRSPATTAASATPSWTPTSASASVVSQEDTVRAVSYHFLPLFSQKFLYKVFFMIHSNLLLLNSHHGGGKLQSFWLHKMFRFLINWLDSGSISWLRLKLRMSGTESCNILCNAACSWLASEKELQLLFTV